MSKRRIKSKPKRRTQRSEITPNVEPAISRKDSIYPILFTIMVLLLGYLLIPEKKWLFWLTNTCLIIMSLTAYVYDVKPGNINTVPGYFVGALAVITVIGFSMQAFELELPEPKMDVSVEKSDNVLPRPRDTVFETKKDERREPVPMIEILGTPQLTVTDSTAHFKVTITAIDDNVAIINGTSAIIFRTDMVLENKPLGTFEVHELENTIVSNKIPVTFTQNAKGPGSRSDTLYTYLKIKFSNKNHKVQKPDFTRLYVCVKNKNNEYEVFYMTRKQKQEVFDYLASKNKL